MSPYHRSACGRQAAGAADAQVPAPPPPGHICAARHDQRHLLQPCHRRRKGVLTLVLSRICPRSICAVRTASSCLQGSDNTRHRSHHPVTGEPYLLPPQRIRRVILCTGQIYYRLRCASANFGSAAVSLQAAAWNCKAQQVADILCGPFAATRAVRQRSGTSLWSAWSS